MAAAAAILAVLLLIAGTFALLGNAFKPPAPRPKIPIAAATSRPTALAPDPRDALASLEAKLGTVVKLDHQTNLPPEAIKPGFIQRALRNSAPPLPPGGLLLACRQAPPVPDPAGLAACDLNPATLDPADIQLLLAAMRADVWRQFLIRSDCPGVDDCGPRLIAALGMRQFDPGRIHDVLAGAGPLESPRLKACAAAVPPNILRACAFPGREADQTRIDDATAGELAVRLESDAYANNLLPPGPPSAAPPTPPAKAPQPSLPATAWAAIGMATGAILGALLKQAPWLIAGAARRVARPAAAGPGRPVDASGRQSPGGAGSGFGDRPTPETARPPAQDPLAGFGQEPRPGAADPPPMARRPAPLATQAEAPPAPTLPPAERAFAADEAVRPRDSADADHDGPREPALPPPPPDRRAAFQAAIEAFRRDLDLSVPARTFSAQAEAEMRALPPASEGVRWAGGAIIAASYFAGEIPMRSHASAYDRLVSALAGEGFRLVWPEDGAPLSESMASIARGPVYANAVDAVVRPGLRGPGESGALIVRPKVLSR